MLTEPTTTQYPLDQIDAPDSALRESIDEDALSALADSMGAHGLRQPIGLRARQDNPRAEVIWGHRRFLAALTLGWLTIEAKLYPWDYSPAIARIEENLVRADLNPREEARAAQELATSGRSMAEISRIMRRSPAWVAQRLRILTWPQELGDAVAAGELGISVADALAQVDHHDYRGELIKEAVRTGATRRTVDTWIAAYLADRDRIIQNHETIAQIINRRETYIVTTPCEVCDTVKPLAETALIRACTNCLRELDDAKHAAEVERRTAAD